MTSMMEQIYIFLFWCYNMQFYTFVPLCVISLFKCTASAGERLSGVKCNHVSSLCVQRALTATVLQQAHYLSLMM